jgi:formate dehydrogenase major subunit
MPACTTQVVDGMVISTNSEGLTKSRQMALELLLSDHYGDCIAPCQLACPAGIDIQGYIALIASGQYLEALKLIKEKNPMPLVVGRVCPRFCEKKCRRNVLDEPVAINCLKRFAADYNLDGGDIYTPEAKPSTGHRIAVVGGGPAGLSAAYYLALEGHEVTIFESSPQLGGMLRYGIPEYRLPKAILDKEIASITRLCHEVRYGMLLGRDLTVETLKKEGYEAVFLALGAQASQKMGVEGENLPGVLSGIGFLRDVALGKAVDVGQRVAVIGGGNTAMDAARTALRLKATEVTIVYRRSREEMPASDEEIEQAEEEGIRFQFLAAPVKASVANGRVISLECVRMALGAPDSSGRRRPEPIAGSEFTMSVDTVIAAIGQTLDTAGFAKDGAVKLDRRGYVDVKKETMETTLDGVFAGGDCTSGPATVIEAIATGRRAAVSINQYLKGEKVAPPQKPYVCTKGELDEIDPKDYESKSRIPRGKVVAVRPEVRRANFAEIEPGFTEEMARAETERCLACGCLDAFECKLRDYATEYGVNDKRYAGRRRHLPVKENEHPYIVNDPNKCILCGRCVRICNEVEGIGALGFSNRGFRTRVEPALGMPLAETACNSCGQCVSTCPTGALTPKIQLSKPGPWQAETVPTVCPYCGVGCNLTLNVVGDKVVSVTSPLDSPVNEGSLCKKGAFYPASLHNLKRLKTPLIKRNDSLVEASWEEALALAGNGLKQIRDRAGGDRLAVLASAMLTNEEHYLVQKLARAVLGTNNLGCLARPNDANLLAALGKNASTCSFNDILASDLVMVYGCDLAESYPIIALKIRKAVSRGSKLITLSPRQTGIDSLAKTNLKVNRRTGVNLLQSILGYIITYDLADHDFVDTRTANFNDFVEEIGKQTLEELTNVPWAKPSKIVEAIHLLVRARHPVLVLDAATISPLELDLLSNLMLATGNVGRGSAGIILLRTPGNAQGLIDMGVSPDFLPGQEPVGNPIARQRFEAKWGGSIPAERGRDLMEIMRSIESGEIQGVLVAGSDADSELGSAIFEVPIFSVLIDTVAPEKPPYPDVVLPAATFAESQGTYTNCERRIQRLRAALSPAAGKENWQILVALAHSLGYSMSYPTVASIDDEIAELVPLYQGIKEPDPGKAAQWLFSHNGKFDLEDGLARFRLLEPNPLMR